jgi:hypothetical protein
MSKWELFFFLHATHQITCFTPHATTRTNIGISEGGGGVGSFHSGSQQKFLATLNLPEHSSATALFLDFMNNHNESDLHRLGIEHGSPNHSPALYLLSLLDGLWNK